MVCPDVQTIQSLSTLYTWSCRYEQLLDIQTWSAAWTHLTLPRGRRVMLHTSVWPHTSVLCTKLSYVVEHVYDEIYTEPPLHFNGLYTSKMNLSYTGVQSYTSVQHYPCAPWYDLSSISCFNTWGSKCQLLQWKGQLHVLPINSDFSVNN